MDSHIITTELGDGLYRLVPEEGYYMVSSITYKKHSEAITSNPNDFESRPQGTPPQPHVRTLEEAKQEKIRALYAYDSSTAVNSFSVGNLTTWISKEERPNMRNTVIAYQSRGDETVEFQGVTVPVETALFILTQLDIYAAECFKQTKRHEAAINAKRTIKTVDEYDFTTGYPDKLAF